MNDHWNIIETDPDVVSDLCEKSGLSPVTSHLLVHLGLTTPDAAHAFMHPSLTSLRSPFLMKGMNRAVERIVRAIKASETILVFGDYDADGITGTRLLQWFLNYAGARVCTYIPHRIYEGYSFKPHHVDDVLVPGGIDLLVTVDCGSDSIEAVDKANRKGIDVVITDHHSVPDPAPAALAIVNPKQPECTSGMEHLAGVGVVFYLLIALRKTLRDQHFWQTVPEPNLKTVCDLVALGTIADIVPLVAENRILAKTGIEMMNQAPRPGIKALLDASKVNKIQLNTEDVAFRIAPRINAAGRMDHAEQAFDLLSEERITHARKNASVLETLNARRQSVEQQIVREIENHLEENAQRLSQPAIVLYRQGWHLGVLGIAAARLVKRYYKPVILIAMNGDIGKGSGRSIPGVDLYRALQSCSDSLRGFGGHAMAGGLEIHTRNVEDFHRSFNTFVGSVTQNEPSRPSMDVHGPICFDDITPRLLDELELLHPFGNGNPEPLFMSERIQIISATPVGTAHRRLILRSESGASDQTIMAMHFNVDPSTPYPASFDRLVYKLQWNRWNNTQSAQLIVEDFE